MAMPHYTLALLPVLHPRQGPATLCSGRCYADRIPLSFSSLSYPGAARNRRSTHRPNSELATCKSGEPVIGARSDTRGELTMP